VIDLNKAFSPRKISAEELIEFAEPIQELSCRFWEGGFTRMQCYRLAEYCLRNGYSQAAMLSLIRDVGRVAYRAGWKFTWQWVQEGKLKKYEKRDVSRDLPQAVIEYRKLRQLYESRT
jgi:hypothetical protein